MEEYAAPAFGAELDVDPGTARGPMRVVEVSDADSPLESPTESTVDSVLATCRQSDWRLDPEMTVLFGEDGQSRGAEEFRVLRTQLYSVREQRKLKTILVASALPKEGRSFVATNLARVLALQEGCRVLLIDADLRNPKLHSAFGTSARPGLSDYLMQVAGEFAVMERNHSEGLILIPAGRLVQGQTELIANGRLQNLINQVEPLFDWIIVDSPATMPVMDAPLLANCCDGVVLVVRSESTPFDIVKKARGRFRDESLVGVVLNKIESDGSRGK